MIYLLLKILIEYVGAIVDQSYSIKAWGKFVLDISVVFNVYMLFLQSGLSSIEYSVGSLFSSMN